MKDDGTDFMKSFTDAFKDKLGPRAADVIVEDWDSIRELKQREKEAEIQLQQSETLASQREEEKKEIEVLRGKIEKNDVRIDQIQDQYGSNLESQTELRRLQQMKKNYATDLEERQKKLDSLTKSKTNR